MQPSRPQNFDQTYRATAAPAFAAAYRVLRDAAAAEDVVQDVFLQLWRKPHSFDPTRGTLHGYVTMLARSRALDRWRSRAVREDAAERAAEATRPREAGESAAEPVIRRERSRRILCALDELPGPQRQALLLAFGRGLTAREIASATDVPVGTAKSRLRLGLRRAGTALEQVA